MVVLITCKNEEDPIKNESARRVTTLNINLQTIKGRYICNYVVGGGVGLKLIQAFMVVFVTCKKDEDQSKKMNSL